MASGLKVSIGITLFLLLGCALLSANKTELQLQEVSRFAFTSHDMATRREAVIRYPYVYLPNSYGFQVSIWDSLANTFTEVANYGVQGSVHEMVAWQDYLFLAVGYGFMSEVQPDMGALYKVDISDPLHPQAAGLMPVGEEEIKYGNLHIVGDALLANDEYYGGLHNLVQIDPVTLSIVGTYPGHYHFEVIRGQYVISRPYNSSQFHLFDVDPSSGLNFLGYLSLPHYTVNTFPLIFDVRDSFVATQCGEGIRIWDTANLFNWELLSMVEQPFSARGVYASGWLVGANYEVAEDLTRFYIYNLTEPANPVLASTTNYPSGLGYPTGGVERMTPQGTFLFHCNMNQGCLCLGLDNSGNLSFSGRCYRFNLTSGHGRNYGSYILRSSFRGGVACFDVSDPQNPHYAFTLWDGLSVRFDICGDLMLALFDSSSGNPPTQRIYDLSDLQNPQLVASYPLTQYVTTFFNYDEPNAFYQLDNSVPNISKYSVLNDQASLVCGVYLPEPVQSPTFVNGLLHLLRPTANDGNGLYTCSGFPENAPLLGELIPAFFHPDYADMYNAGEFAFVRTFSHSLPALFYNPTTTLMVRPDYFGFDFRNYVCIGRETGVSFYDFSDATGIHDWVAEDLFLPQCSYTTDIDWDDNYLYLLCNDNVAIYAYTITTAAEDPVAPAPFELSSWPNPFNPSCSLKFSLPQAGRASLDIYNAKGQKVRSLLDGELPSGESTWVWEGRDDSGQTLPSGLYFARLSTEQGSSIRKLMLIK
ncbi:MAG: T9SS type A sorting domain-containing protein [Candidatus Syntrophosphaera sp.]|nr:T9SS type A sorting domain-containing protein [Candidatus Syntrophosphaera sp.]